MSDEMRARDVPPQVNTISGDVVAAAVTVHRTLGPGLLESAYRKCLAHELSRRGRAVAEEVPRPIEYAGSVIDLAYRMDLLVDHQVVVEVKAVQTLHPVHFAQLLTYLRLSRCRVGILVNFHERFVRDGIHRLVA